MQGKVKCFVCGTMAKMIRPCQTTCGAPACKAENRRVRNARAKQRAKDGLAEDLRVPEENPAATKIMYPAFFAMIRPVVERRLMSCLRCGDLFMTTPSQRQCASCYRVNLRVKA